MFQFMKVRPLPLLYDRGRRLGFSRNDYRRQNVAETDGPRDMKCKSQRVHRESWLRQAVTGWTAAIHPSLNTKTRAWVPQVV